MKLVMQYIKHKFTNMQLAILLLIIVAYMIVVICSSWLADDAYITLRVVDNFMNGHGLRWNISERVQTYTHALWMMALIPVYAMTRSHYYSPLVLSWLLSMFSAIAIIILYPKSFRSAIAIGLTMIMSKASIDYATSGLENPLTHFLIICFFAAWLSEQQTARRTFILGFISGLLLMNRHDAALLIAPALVWEIGRKPTLRNILILAFGMSPIIIWEIFSLAYYGFPFPNTAYAKLNTAASRHHLVMNGWYYILHTIMYDPLTMAVILATLIVSLISGNSKSKLICLGGVLYLAYITWAGGDFMSGRFFSGPLYMAFIAFSLLDTTTLPKKTWGLVLCGILLSGLSIRNPTIFLGPNYGKRGDISAHQQYRGVNDERSFYYQHTGILARRGKAHWPDHAWRNTGEEIKRDHKNVFEFYSVGMLGFFAGQNVHVIDILGLGDPLLARIEHLGVNRTDTTYMTEWGLNVTQGHYERSVPLGYAESLRTGTNHIKDPNLHEYYDHLKLVISGPIWSRARWISIWKLNSGHYQFLLDAYQNPASKVPEQEG